MATRRLILFLVACLALTPIAAMSETKAPETKPPEAKSPVPTLELLSKDAEIPIPWAKNAGVKSPIIFIIAKAADASQVLIRVAGISQDGGISIPQQALTFNPTSFRSLKQNQPAPIDLVLDPKLLRRPGKYKARILLQAANAVPVEGAIVLSRPEAGLEAYPNPFVVSLTRWWPFPICQNPCNATRMISLRETSSLAAVEDITVQAGPLLIEKGPTMLGKVDLALGSQSSPVSSMNPAGQLFLFATIAGITKTGEFVSEIRLQSPDLKQPLTIPIKLTVTDFALFPFLAIVAGVVASYWVSKLTGGRRALILERSLIQLDNEVAAHIPSNHANRPKLIALINLARGQLDQGNLDGAKATLDQAEKLYHESLIQNLGVQPNLTGGTIRYVSQEYADMFRNLAGQQEPPTIACDDSPVTWDTERDLNFRVVNPSVDWTDTTGYTWNFGDESPPLRKTGQEGQLVRHRFALPGRYEISFNVQAGTTAQTTLHFSVEIKASRVSALKKRLAWTDLVLASITIGLASVIGLLTLYFSGKPFGSLVDYIGALLWGFGLDQTVKGYAAVKSRLGW